MVVVRHVSADSRVDDSIGATYYLVIVDIPEGEALSGILNGGTFGAGDASRSFYQDRVETSNRLSSKAVNGLTCALDA